MKQVYHSELTGKYYESKQECLDAEKEYNEKTLKLQKEKEERKEFADLVAAKYEDYVQLCKEHKKQEVNAYNDYIKTRNDFLNKYGSYHLTITQKGDELPTANFDTLDNVVKSFFERFTNRF